MNINVTKKHIALDGDPVPDSDGIQENSSNKTGLRVKLITIRYVKEKCSLFTVLKWLFVISFQENLKQIKNKYCFF